MKTLYTTTLLLILSSCATKIDYHMPNVRYLTPETSGKFLDGHLAISYENSSKVVTSEAIDGIVFNTPYVSNQ